MYARIKQTFNAREDRMEKVTEIFGSMVFNDSVMEALLPKQTYKALQSTIKQGKRLDAELASVVANAMKDGNREGCNALHPLVPAYDRSYSREA